MRNKFEIVHIRVGHIGKRVGAPLSIFFVLSFPTQKNIGEVTHEEVSRMAKYVKNGQNKAQKSMQYNSNEMITQTYLSQVTLKWSGCTYFITIQSLHTLVCDLGVHTQCAHMQNGQNGKKRPTKSVKMCGREVEMNLNSCKFESSDLGIGCGCRQNIFSTSTTSPVALWGTCIMCTHANWPQMSKKRQ